MLSKINLKRLAFTLAEVLIVLGIIGIVAEMTIPTLVNNFQKQVAVTRLQKFYTNMFQAIRLSENENGPTNTWDYGEWDNGASTLTWFNTYLDKYFRYNTKKSDSTGVDVKMADGSMVRFTFHAYIHMYFFPDGDKKQMNGRNVFVYFIRPELKTKSFVPFDFHGMCADKIGTREYWTCDTEYGCNNVSTNKVHCAGLIMHDNWQIKDDYPW